MEKELYDIFLCVKEKHKKYTCKRFDTYRQADAFFSGSNLDDKESYLIPVPKVFPQKLKKHFLHKYITDFIKVDIK